MSFLTQTAARRVPRVSRVMAMQAPRAFTISARLQKTPTESVKDGLDTANRAVGDTLVGGIDAATKASQKVKEGAESMTSGSTKGKAEELKGDAKGKAEELKGKAKGAAEDVKSKI